MKIDANDLGCDEDFINVSMNNIHHLTTDQIKGKPIIDQNRNKKRKEKIK